MAGHSENDTCGFSGEGYSPRAGLAALGLKLTQLDLFAPVRSLVTIDQKTLKYRPDQKLYTAFVTILAGGQRMTERTKIVHGDPLLQKAFGEAVSRRPIGRPSHPRCLYADKCHTHATGARLSSSGATVRHISTHIRRAINCWMST